MAGNARFEGTLSLPPIANRALVAVNYYVDRDPSPEIVDEWSERTVLRAIDIATGTPTELWPITPGTLWLFGSPRMERRL